MNGRRNEEIGRVVLTPGGLRRLEERLQRARAAYFKVCASNEEAAGAGDSSVWHDNFAYEENQRQMHMLARRVRSIERLKARVEVVPLARNPERVCVGCTVVVEWPATGERRRFLVAGYDDGDLVGHRIAYNAPLGRALIGAEEGDERAVRLPSRVERVVVDEIQDGDAQLDEA